MIRITDLAIGVANGYRMVLKSGSTIIARTFGQDENGRPCDGGDSEAIAQEMARRLNLHEDLVQTLHRIVSLETSGGGNAYIAANASRLARSALSKVEKGGD